jgi:hypothetical protein
MHLHFKYINSHIKTYNELNIFHEYQWEFLIDTLTSQLSKFKHEENIFQELTHKFYYKIVESLLLIN